MPAPLVGTKVSSWTDHTARHVDARSAERQSLIGDEESTDVLEVAAFGGLPVRARRDPSVSGLCQLSCRPQ